MGDDFSARYGDLLTGSYDCVDRIVLNAYYPLGHGAGGFRTWWRRLHGSDEQLDDTHLMRMAGRLARRVKAWGAANGVPVVFCKAGERKHRIAEEFLATHEVSGPGVFLVLAAKAPATVWKVKRSARGVITNLEKKREYVNHYSFHLIDPDWGHMTIKMSGHPPFGAQVILNGHEWVACQAREAGIAFGKDGNCFTAVADPAGLARVADALSQHATVGRLGQVCDRWIYTACLCFALDLDEQRRSGFGYAYSVFQVEYSRKPAVPSRRSDAAALRPGGGPHPLPPGRARGAYHLRRQEPATSRRAREHVHARRPRYQPDPRVRQQVTERFLAAALGGDLDALLQILAPEVTLWGDSGGKTQAAGGLRPLQGRDKVARLLAAVAPRFGKALNIVYRSVNGDPSALLLAGDTPYAVVVLDLTPDGQVCGIYAVANPDKLSHVD